jgi:Fe-S cluster biogenesis protein NfuA
MTTARREFTRRSERIEELVHRIENAGDLATRAVAQELLQCVIELHGAALERILEAVAELNQGEAALKSIARDELVSGVLALHDLHPLPLETRVALALNHVLPSIHSHGGDLELQSIKEGVVSVRLRTAPGCCGSSAQTIKRSVEEAIYSAAPEVSSVIAEHIPAEPQSILVTLRAS